MNSEVSSILNSAENFDDYHASRVLPGFLPDSKMKMLIELKDEAEMIIAINANDIEKARCAVI